MSNSNNFSGTITGGIQDISALLPLLGTEQCENHVGSALDRGFLYSSVTPVSIFGSLGIVRAAFNILVASLNIQQYRFLGARKLSDGGFTTTGVVAPMIALDPQNPKRFLAETRFEAMLTEEHIENVEDLTVSWGERIILWNILLIASTLVISSAGLVPYIHLILDSHHTSFKAPFPLGFGFPILRVVGSALCVTFAQFLLQIRLMVLLKTRLLFITIDRLAKRAGVEVETEMNVMTNKPQKMGGGNIAWNPEVASETCIWALQRWLAESDAEKSKNHSILNEFYTSEHRRQMESIDTRIPYWVNHVLVFGLVFGCFSAIAGYVGCFYLIQRSTSSNGPLLWLVLEALLSIIRILVWAINPSWDDSNGIVFELQLAPHALLVTCNKLQDDIKDDGVAPLTRSNRFLEEVVAYTGPFPVFMVDDVALYYIIAAEGRSSGPRNSERSGLLYIVLSDHKEQTSRIIYKKSSGDDFSIHVSSLHPVPRSTAINVKVDFSEGETQTDAHFLTSDPVFMAQLGGHYDEIIRRIRMGGSNRERKASFGKTWAMQRPSKNNNDNNAESPMIDLTKDDLAYLRQGQVERRWHDLYLRLEEWIGLFISLYTKELLEDVPEDLGFKKDEPVKIMQKYEANEVEFLLIECQRILELLLISAAKEWDTYVTRAHERMVDDVVKDSVQSEQGASANGKRHSEDIRKKKLRTRLETELTSLLEKERQMRMDNRQHRLTVQMELTRQRIEGRKYADAIGQTLMKEWTDLPGALPSEATETSTVAKSASNMGPVVALSTARSKPATLPSTSGPRQHAHGTNEQEVWHWRLELEASMRGRYEAAKTEINDYKDSVERSKQLVGVGQMEVRCRQRADQLLSRLKAQADEFRDLHTDNVLTADTSFFVKYWSKESLQERRRLQDRTQKYLSLTDASIEAVGGPQNMQRALKRSQEFLFIDIRVRKASNLLTGEEITSVVKSVKSVAGVTSSQDDQEIYKAVMANVRAAVEVQSRDICWYANVVATDYYRKGEPYLLFAIPGASFCNAYFHIKTKCDHTVTLRHCVTKNGKVDIMLNGHELEGSWGQTRMGLSNHDFINEDIPLPNDHLRDIGQPNVLEIILGNDSSGVYWLSDVFLPVQPIQVAVRLDTSNT